MSISFNTLPISAAQNHDFVAIQCNLDGESVWLAVGYWLFLYFNKIKHILYNYFMCVT